MLMSLVYLQQRKTEMSKNNKKEKEIKIVNVEEENLKKKIFIFSGQLEEL